MKEMHIPKKGTPRDDMLSRLEAMKSGDTDWQSGRMFSLIYNAGEDIRDITREAFNIYFMENGLSPFAFPSLKSIGISIPRCAFFLSITKSLQSIEAF